MRGITAITAIVLSALSLAVAQPHVNVNASANFSFDELNQYGEWVNVSGYGDVWRPYAGDDWRPFLYGRWQWSSDGWMWESDEPFGWIVCHYGNWTYDDDWGWVWVPGYDWSPARVDWHVTDAEIGWMPMPPSGYRSHARVEWTFCPFNAFADVEIHSHVSYRPQTSVAVHVGPPQIDVVRRHSRVQIVTVAPHKVYVESSHRRFVRVEVEPTHRHTVVVPIGPQFRVRAHTPQHAVTVESRTPEPPRGGGVVFEARVPAPRVNVTVTNEAPRHYGNDRNVVVRSHHDNNNTVVVPSRHEGERSTVVVPSNQRNHGVNKVRVESNSDDGRHHPGAVRAKVTVRKQDRQP